MSEELPPEVPTKSKKRQATIWSAIREKGVPLALMSLAVACIAGVPLENSTLRRTAEFRIRNIQWEILELQEEKANVLREYSDKVTLKALQDLGTKVGLGPPKKVEYISVSNSLPTPTPTATPESAESR